MPEIVNIGDEIARLDALGVLKPLLADKSTGGNILWATDAYAERGTRYAPDAEITPDLITGDENAGIIQTRAQKAAEQQSARTRRRAEVYTPLWVCRTMCDNLDAVWFRRKDGFNRLDPATGRVRFPKNRTWTAYVKSTRMEITCGEGPFLASRYDAPTGTTVPVRERVGLLDRKLRAVSENADNETDWLKWAARAFQSSYGYEFQGDSLLIARVNAMMTFAEHFSERWGHFPDADGCKAIADIIAWNLWQMDGLTDAAPYRTLEKYPQMVISGWTVSQIFMPDAPKRCHIYDWRHKGDVEYALLKEGGEKTMKFDFIIGNPPYQESGQTNNKAEAIYHYFYEGVEKLADRYMLISPARFLFNAGLTPKVWNKKMLSDSHLKVIEYFPDSSSVFSSANINGGVVVVYRDVHAMYEPIGNFIPDNTLRKIAQRFSKDAENNLSSICYGGRSDLKFNATLFEEYPDTRERILETIRKKHPSISKLAPNEEYEIKSSSFERTPYVFLSEEPYDSHNYYKILGLENGKRIYKWVAKKFLSPRFPNHNNIGKYKVLISNADGAAGQIGKPVPARIIGKPIIAVPDTSSIPTFMSIGSFESEEEAQNVEKYVKTKFCRVLVGILKITQHITPSTWAYVPLQNFTPDSDIDWSKPIPEIDRQLYAKYNLDEKEIAFIESHVKAME